MTVDNSKYTLSANHYNDSRLFKCTLDGLNPKEMCSLVCQLLNVHGVSKKVNK